MYPAKASNEELIESYGRLGNIWKVAEEFGMCGQSVWERLKKLGYEDKDKWTEKQLNDLKLAYQGNDGKPINLRDLEVTIGKNRTNICRKARQLGLGTSFHRERPEYLKEIISKRVKEWLKTHPHPKGSYKPDNKIRICPVCGRFFVKPPSSKQKYCGRACASNHRQIEGKQGYAKIGRREDLNNQYFRSSWEANYARYLNYLIKQQLGIAKWEYEPITFPLANGTEFYTPDFKVTMLDGSIEYHEVKGWDYTKGKKKRERFIKEYPYKKLVLIDQYQYKKMIDNGIDSIIDNWEYSKQDPLYRKYHRNKVKAEV